MVRRKRPSPSFFYLLSGKMQPRFEFLLPKLSKESETLVVVPVLVKTLRLGLKNESTTDVSRLTDCY